MSGSPPAPAAIARGVLRPSDRQEEVIGDLLRSQPGLRRGGHLLLLYGENRITEASWLCAYARSAGLVVRLAAVAHNAHAIERRLRQEATGRLTVFVLADMTLDVPPGTVQLAGTQDQSPLDLWQPEVSGQAQAAALTLPRDLVVRTGDGATLDVTVDTHGWLADTGLRQAGQALVLPAGAAHASVARATGTFVADGAISLNRAVNLDARLTERPVTVTVQDTVVTSVTCADGDLLLFLSRAFQVHRATNVRAVRMGVNRLIRGFSPVQGPANGCCRGVTLQLGVDAGHPYSPASADLRIDLTATSRGDSGDPGREPR